MTEAKEKDMDLETINRIIAIAERLPTDGHSLTDKDVSDIMSKAEWIVCYDWYKANAKDCVILYQDQSIQSKSSVQKNVLLARLENYRKEVGKADYDRELNNKVLTDTLKHNRITRLIAWLAFGVSILAILTSIFVPLLTD